MTDIRYPVGHSSTDWGLILSSGNAAGIPSGDVIYLFANKVKVNKATLDKTNYTSNNKARRLARGKKKLNVSAPSVWVPTRSMTELNACNAYLNAWAQNGHAPIYLWIRTKVVATWVYYDFPDVDGSMVNYLMGYVDVDDDDLDQLFLKSLKFSNAYTGGT